MVGLEPTTYRLRGDLPSQLGDISRTRTFFNVLSALSTHGRWAKKILDRTFTYHWPTVWLAAHAEHTVSVVPYVSQPYSLKQITTAEGLMVRSVGGVIPCLTQSSRRERPFSVISSAIISATVSTKLTRKFSCERKISKLWILSVFPSCWKEIWTPDFKLMRLACYRCIIPRYK